MTPLPPCEYVERFASDLPPKAQVALFNLIETLVSGGDPRCGKAQHALDQFLDAAGQGGLKGEPARSYIQHFIENPNVIAARYFYKDSSKVLAPAVRNAVITLVVRRFFWEVWTYGPEA